MSNDLFFLESDGYESTACYAPEFPFKKPFRIKYRFPIPEDRDKLQASLNRAIQDLDPDSDEAVEHKAIETCKMLVNKIVSWEFEGVDPAKQPPITVDVLRRIPPSQFRRLANTCIYGLDGGDPDPRESKKKPPESPNEQLAENQGN